MKPAITSSHSQYRPRDELLPLSWANRAKPTSAMVRTRPAQAAAIVAVYCRLVIFQMPARKIRPPSSGSPGSRLKIPTIRFAKKSCEIS